MVRGEGILVLSLAILLLFSFSIYAQTASETEFETSNVQSSFDSSSSYSWLNDKITNMTPQIGVRSLATIALIQRGTGQFSGLIDEIRKVEDQTQHCWPSTGCNVKDTALATLTLALSGQEVSQEVQWLKDARIAGLPPGGEWSLSIKAESDGVCGFTFTGVDAERQFTLEGDRVRSPNNQYTAQQYYIRLNELQPTLVTSNVQPQINVNCEVINPIITLLYKPNQNTFFIQRSDAGASQNFKVANACFGNTRGTGPCNYESTAYATWALLEIGLITNDETLSLENIGTHIYLESQAINQRNDVKGLGLLNRILIKASNAAPSFILDLVNLQRISDGSWSNSVHATAVATFGLTGSDKNDAVTRGLDYLRKNVDNDGSWNNDLETTSWALIALHGGDLSRISVTSDFTGSSTEICGNDFDDDVDGISDCGEIECSSDSSCQCLNGVRDGDEEGEDCGGSCGTACTSTDEPGCSIDADCLSGEVCISGTCVFESEPEEDETEGEPTTTVEEGSSWWIWLLIIIVLLGGGYLFYTKYIKTGKIKLNELFKKKPKQPSFDEYRRQAEFRPMQQKAPQRPAVGQVLPQRRPMQSTKPKEDLELENSMREAERILKGK